MSSIYSQGFNYGRFVHDGVDTRTGQFSCSIDLYEAPAATRNYAQFKLKLQHDMLNFVNTGWGKGWSLNISSYDHGPGKTLRSYTGEHYKANENSSGSIDLIDQKLKAFKFVKRDGKYYIIYKTGRIEVLENDNNRFPVSLPFKIHGPNGRALSLVWSYTAGSNQPPQLTGVFDGTVQLVRINYSASVVNVIHAPGSTEEATFVYKIVNDNLAEIDFPGVSPAWKLSYANIGTFSCISETRNPLGMIEKVVYRQAGHKLPPGAPYQTIPYVTEHTQDPGAQQSKITTSYSFSDHNFLGYGSGLNWQNVGDNLYHAPGTYRYSVTSQVVGGPTTIFTYNKFHLTYSLEKTLLTKKTTHLYTYYANQSTDLQSQPPQYQLPKQMDITFEDSSSLPAKSRKETYQQEFDEWGNPTLEVLPTGVKIQRTYFPESGDGANCPPDPYGFRRSLKEERIVPPSKTNGEPSRGRSYTYTSIPVIFEPRDLHPYHLVQQRSYQFSDNSLYEKRIPEYFNDPNDWKSGLLKTELSELIAYKTNKTYTYNLLGSIVRQQATITGFDGQKSTESRDISFDTGRIMSDVDAAGVARQYQYSKMGDLIATVKSAATPHRATVDIQYIIANSVPAQVVTTNTKGVRYRRTLDGLGRLCKLEQQDIDGGDGGSPSASYLEIGLNTYDAQGRLYRKTATDYLRDPNSGSLQKKQTNAVTYTYDDWGQVATTVTNSGRKEYTRTDLVSRKTVSGQDGEGYTETTQDAFGNATSVRRYHRNGQLESEIMSSYDSLGRLISETDPFGVTTTVKYDIWNRVVEKKLADGTKYLTEFEDHTILARARKISVVTANNTSYVAGTQSFDSLGRRTAKTIGGRTTTYAYQADGRVPRTVSPPNGIPVSFETNPQLNDVVVSSSANNGLSQRFGYDPQTAWPLDVSEGSNSSVNQYFPSGLLKEQRDTLYDGQTAFRSTSRFQHSLLGKLQTWKRDEGSNTFSDTYSHTYDDYGRLVTVTDVPYQTSITYDVHDRQISISTKNTTTQIEMQTKLEYDDLSRPISREIVRNGRTLSKIKQTYNAADQVVSRIFSNASNVSVRTEAYEYDKQRRLVKYDCVSSSSGGVPSDERGRAIRQQLITYDTLGNIKTVKNVFTNGAEDTLQYQYQNQKDFFQVTSLQGTSPSRTLRLQYDTSGQLILDEEGRGLSYDALGRLIKVTDPSGNTSSQYYYDPQRLKGQSYRDQNNNLELHRLRYRSSTVVGEDTTSSTTKYAKVGRRTVACQGQKDGRDYSILTGTDLQGSPHTSFDGITANKAETYYAHDPFGNRSVSGENTGLFPMGIGLNGERIDPATKNYLLGGRRAYSPSTRLFQYPDTLSPFGLGGINPYAYCFNDPVNRSDPSGLFSLFGWEVSGRTIALLAVGLVVGIGVTILTGGAGLAVAVGVGSVAAGVSDAATGAIYDLATGHKPTWQSVATDAGTGVVGALAGEGIGFVAAPLLKAAGRGISKSFTGLTSRLASREAGSVAYSANRGTLTLAWDNVERGLNPLGMQDPIVFFNRIDGVEGQFGILSHGYPSNHPQFPGRIFGELPSAQGAVHYPITGDIIARETVLPLIQRSSIPHDRGKVFTLISCFGAESGTGQAIANVLGQDVRGFRGLAQAGAGAERQWGRGGYSTSILYNRLEQPGGVQAVFGDTEVLSPHGAVGGGGGVEPMDWE
ncbi:hypothetical protein TWF506_008002 [Arthrobotrys conoides]|uniref:RHS repeat-associated core domain-containing protein n=1 Tax=Arthrobotrys conoides TaxID=74498 RepID=A0AAN8NMK7_9PEZI